MNNAFDKKKPQKVFFRSIIRRVEYREELFSLSHLQSSYKELQFQLAETAASRLNTTYNRPT